MLASTRYVTEIRCSEPNTMLARFDWQLRRSTKLSAVHRTLRPRMVAPALFLSMLAAWLIYRHLGRPAWQSELPVLISESLTLLEAAAVLTTLLLTVIYLWRAHKEMLRASQTVTIEYLYSLSPRAFERYVADLFRKKGYQVKIRGRSGDHGVDLEIEQTGKRRAIVQCKRYRNVVGPEIVRELFGTMVHERVHHAFLVTTAEISPAARAWAKNKPMTLIDGPNLVQIAASLQANRTP